MGVSVLRFSAFHPHPNPPPSEGRENYAYPSQLLMGEEPASAKAGVKVRPEPAKGMRVKLRVIRDFFPLRGTAITLTLPLWEMGLVPHRSYATVSTSLPKKFVASIASWASAASSSANVWWMTPRITPLPANSTICRRSSLRPINTPNTVW